MYWQLLDARRNSALASERQRVLALVHGIADATATTLYSGNRALRVVDNIGDLPADVQGDPGVHRALGLRPARVITENSAWQLADATVVSEACWRRLEVQGIGVGLLRMVVAAPRSLHGGVPALMDFMADWFAETLIHDSGRSTWINATSADSSVQGPRFEAAGLARLILDRSHARSWQPQTRASSQTVAVLESVCAAVLDATAADRVAIYRCVTGGRLQSLARLARPGCLPFPSLDFDLLPALRRALLEDRPAVMAPIGMLGNGPTTVYPLRTSLQAVGLMLVGGCSPSSSSSQVLRELSDRAVNTMVPTPVPTPQSPSGTDGNPTDRQRRVSVDHSDMFSANDDVGDRLGPAVESVGGDVDLARRRLQLLASVGESLDPIVVARRLAHEVAREPWCDDAVVCVVARERVRAMAWIGGGRFKTREELQARLEEVNDVFRHFAYDAEARGGLLLAGEPLRPMAPITLMARRAALAAARLTADSLLVVIGSGRSPDGYDTHAVTQLRYAVEHTVPAVRNAYRYQKAIREAERDGLTGLRNRRAFDSSLQAALARPHGSVTLAIIDIDDFKTINDRYGHRLGDRVLVRVARQLEAHATAAECEVFRIGGDEFALLTAVGAPGVLQVLRKTAEDLSVPTTELPQVGISAGVIGSASSHASSPDLFVAADGALISAKRQGKNRIEIASTSERESAGSVRPR